MTDFLQTVKERVVVYDGAMGTNIQFRNPGVDDFWGKEGCNELLVLSRPDIIKDIHASFFRVGCDVVETNTFGSTRVVLAEYELQDKTAELNIAAARLAKEVAQQFSTPGRPCFVVGSMGPTTKLPSLGHITFDNMAAAYEEQAAALIDGGVDVLLVETSQDLLQAKAALVGVFDAMQKTGKRLPVTVQVTLEATGTMLLGTEIGAALTALEPFDVDVIGLNCASGPVEMNDAVRFLGGELEQTGVSAAECRTPAERRRARCIQTHASGTGDLSQTFCAGLRSSNCRRMLRDHSRAFEGRRRRSLRRGTGAARGQAVGGGIQRIHVGSSRSRS